MELNHINAKHVLKTTFWMHNIDVNNVNIHVKNAKIIKINVFHVMMVIS